MIHLSTRFAGGALCAALLLAPTGASVSAQQADTPPVEPPTYLLDATFRPRLQPPPVSGSAAEQAEIDELLALNTSRTDDQYWRVAYWDRGSAVGPWTEIELSAIAMNNVDPVRASRALALVSAAVNDAVVVGNRVRAETRRVSPCTTQPALTVLDYWCPDYSYPSDHAVVAGAASTVLGYLFPMDARRYQDLATEAATSRMWGGMNYRSDIEAGLDIGRQVGQVAIDRARGDGADAEWHGTAPTGPGMWVPTPPKALGNFAPPLEPMAGSWRTWSLTSGAQFRPGPPTAPESPAALAEMQEVYDVSQSLTEEQKEIAKFWADNAGTATPAGHWNRLAMDLVNKYMVYSDEAAVIMAALNTAQADAFIAAWDAKYTYWAIRPITVIRRQIDPTWSPYLQTPFFPAYVSGHATVSGAAAEVLAHFFPKDATSLRKFAETAALSRLYGGIHTRTDNNTGLKLGRDVATATLQRVANVTFAYD